MTRNETKPTPAALASTAAAPSAWTELKPAGRGPERAGRTEPATARGAQATATSAITAATTNAQRQPNGIATAGKARPASRAPVGAPACCAPNASPWRLTATSPFSSALTDGPPRALPAPPISISAVSPTAESASAPTARQEAAVNAADSRMPHAAPTRSTSRPAGTEHAADTT